MIQMEVEDLTKFIKWLLKATREPEQPQPARSSTGASAEVEYLSDIYSKFGTPPKEGI